MSILPPPQTEIDKVAFESGKNFHKEVELQIKKSGYDDDFFFSSFEMIFNVEIGKLKKVGIILTDKQIEDTKRFYKSYYFKKKKDSKRCWVFKLLKLFIMIK